MGGEGGRGREGKARHCFFNPCLAVASDWATASIMSALHSWEMCQWDDVSGTGTLPVGIEE